MITATFHTSRQVSVADMSGRVAGHGRNMNTYRKEKKVSGSTEGEITNLAI